MTETSATAARPADIWRTGESVPTPGRIEVGALVQVFLKLDGVDGFHGAFARITRQTQSGYEALVVDGPDEIRNKYLGFSKGHIFDVL